MKVTKQVYVEELDKEVEVEVDIDFEDVIDYVRYETSSFESAEIADCVEDYYDQPEVTQWDVELYLETATMSEKKEFIDILLNRNGHSYILEGTLEEEMKEEWWEAVRRKYTLEQLEEVLGNKFDLM